MYLKSDLKISGRLPPLQSELYMKYNHTYIDQDSVFSVQLVSNAAPEFITHLPIAVTSTVDCTFHNECYDNSHLKFSCAHVRNCLFQGAGRQTSSSQSSPKTEIYEENVSAFHCRYNSYIFTYIVPVLTYLCVGIFTFHQLFIHKV